VLLIDDHLVSISHSGTLSDHPSLGSFTSIILGSTRLLSFASRVTNHIMLRLDFSKNLDGHQFEHIIEHLRSVELNLLLHLILQGFYSISHTSTHIKPHISRVLTRTSKTKRDLEITMGAAEVAGHGNKGGAGGTHLLQKGEGTACCRGGHRAAAGRGVGHGRKGIELGWAP